MTGELKAERRIGAIASAQWNRIGGCFKIDNESETSRTTVSAHLFLPISVGTASLSPAEFAADDAAEWLSSGRLTGSDTHHRGTCPRLPPLPDRKHRFAVVLNCRLPSVREHAIHLFGSSCLQNSSPSIPCGPSLIF